MEEKTKYAAESESEKLKKTNFYQSFFLHLSPFYLFIFYTQKSSFPETPTRERQRQIDRDRKRDKTDRQRERETDREREKEPMTQTQLPDLVSTHPPYSPFRHFDPLLPAMKPTCWASLLPG